jgi:hypothetical protein
VVGPIDNGQEVAVFIAGVADVEVKAAHASRALEAVSAQMRQLRARWSSGPTPMRIIEDIRGPEVDQARRRAREALVEYNVSVSRMRAAVIRTLVDDFGFSFRAAGNLLGISRQMATKLYRSTS